jgi:8-oxo-dGTP pyrophosphatase MutT (NUDIX family)
VVRDELAEWLLGYRTPYPEEQAFVPHFLSLLEHPDCYQRTHLPGHLTGSAWIVNRKRSQVILVHHAKLNRWMQPGGHADGDENILNVALKEAQEETGLTNLTILLKHPFDVDIHRIPVRKDFPEHFHYDVRFLLEADDKEPLKVSEESHDVKWISLDEIRAYASQSSVLRMAEKLFRGD